VSNSNSVTLDLVGVLIERGKTVVSKGVPEHEVRVLKIVHGPGKVSKVDLAADMEPDAVFHSNAYMEWGRLENVYRSKDFNPVAQAFPGGPEDLVAFGFELGREGEMAEQPRSVSVNHGLAERQKAAAERKASKAKKEPKAEK
jgi:hypothetical protein